MFPATLLNPFKSAMHYTYVLQSQKDKKFYTGYSADLKGRFEKHKAGKVSSTRKRLPVQLVYYEACLDKSDAQHRERYLKSHHGKLFLGNRLKSYLTGSRVSKLTTVRKTTLR